MAADLRRREFMVLLGGAGAWPFAARAQPAAGKVWRVGVLETIGPALNAANFDALRKSLGSLGYIEGQNLRFEYRSADGHIERFPELAAELVITGLSAITDELVAKRLELLSEVLPGLKRIAYLQDMGNPVAAPQWDAL